VCPMGRDATARIAAGTTRPKWGFISVADLPMIPVN
jgi:hypothetical protein